MAAALTVAPPFPPPLDLWVRHPADVGEARRQARQLAAGLGLEVQQREAIALAATELATNLVCHAGGGRLILTPLEQAGRRGLELATLDQGPGIPDPVQALTDGFSTAGSLGYGLGTVRRLMDTLDIVSPPGQGTRLVCRKWFGPESGPGPGPEPVPVPVPVPETTARPDSPLDIGAATRPKPGETCNGDDLLILPGRGWTLVGVIDGLGHGAAARQAAAAARGFIQEHPGQPLAWLFQGAGDACRDTRGCVMALARFDLRLGRLSFAALGNIEARVIGAPGHSHRGHFNFMIRRGIVGLDRSEVAETEHAWPPAAMLVLHSDGLDTHWTWADFPDLTDQPAAVIAQGLLRRLARPVDDATVLVVRTPPASVSGLPAAAP